MSNQMAITMLNKLVLLYTQNGKCSANVHVCAVCACARVCVLTVRLCFCVGVFFATIRANDAVSPPPATSRWKPPADACQANTIKMIAVQANDRASGAEEPKKKGARPINSEGHLL